MRGIKGEVGQDFRKCAQEEEILNSSINKSRGGANAITVLLPSPPPNSPNSLKQRQTESLSQFQTPHVENRPHQIPTTAPETRISSGALTLSTLKKNDDSFSCSRDLRYVKQLKSKSKSKSNPPTRSNRHTQRQSFLPWLP